MSFYYLFEQVGKLDILQMVVRAFVIFFLALFLIRITGMRTFGKKSAFDIVVGIILGGVLSRAVTGSSPFFPTVIASVVIVLLHRIVAILSMYSKKMEKLVKGQARELYKNKTINWKNMKRSNISLEDLMESVRDKALVNDLNEIEEARIEQTGEITAVKK
ncbi:DUF421 domain-containing protein [Arachidicoccus sp.]|jgi:uncharacterized membrane protein YcaP (DUF421 family)|uniref:DUF421 domain-containing protein n=1 Tax=Arachidicoccus sp. TaxID=1872624 RepID=UPI003D1F9824